MDMEVDLDEIQYPIIAYINKGETVHHEYLLIEGHKENQLIVHSIERNNLEIPAEVFWSHISSVVLART